MMTPDKLKALEYIVIDFNEYLKTVSVGLEQLEAGVQSIAPLELPTSSDL